MNLIIVFIIILLSVNISEASIFYTVPVEFPSRDDVALWSDSVKGDGAAEFSDALSKYKDGNYEQALNNFSLLVERYPGSEAAAISTLYIGSIYYSMSNLEGKKDSRVLIKSLESFQKSIRSYPGMKSAPLILLEIGKVYLDLNYLAEARGTFKRVIREYPLTGDAAEAQHLLSSIYIEDGRYEEAIKEYQILFLKYPGMMEKERVLGIGEALLSLHEFGKAKKYYDEGIRRWPAYIKGRPEVLLDYSECQFQNGEFLKAREGFLTYYNLYPKNKEAGFALNRVGDTYRLERNGSIAEKIYTNVLYLFPDSEASFVSRLALGDLKLSSESKDISSQDALKYYKEVEEFSDNEALILKARYRSGLVLERQGNYQKAISIYSELLDAGDETIKKEVTPTFYNLLRKIGKEIKGKLGSQDYLSAVRLYQTYYKNILKHVTSEDLLMEIADTHTRLFLYDDASIIYHEILDRNGEKSEIALYKAGELYSHMGDDRRVIETLERYIANYPKGEKVVNARVFAGEALYNLKEYEKAANQFYAVIRDATYGYPSVYIRLSNILQKSRQYGDSATILTDLLKHLAPEKDNDMLLQAYIALGNAYYGLERYEDALDVYKRGLGKSDLNGETEMLQLMIGDCLIRLSRIDEAKKVLSKLSESSNGLIKQFSEERLKDIALNITL